jgi:hypothetical protein
MKFSFGFKCCLEVKQKPRADARGFASSDERERA